MSFSVLQVYVFPLLWWLAVCHSLCYRSTCFLYYDDLLYAILCVTGRLVSFIMMTYSMPFSVLQVDLFPLLWWLAVCHSLCYRSTCFLYYDDLLYAILCVTGRLVSFIMMTYSMPFSVLQVDLFPLLWWLTLCHSLCYRSTCFLYYDDLLYAILCVTGRLVSCIMMTCCMPFSVLQVDLFPLLWWLAVCHSLCYRSTCFLYYDDLLYAILCVTGRLVSFIMMTYSMPFSVLQVDLFPLLWWLAVCHSLCYRSTCFLYYDDLLYAILCVTGRLVSFIMMTYSMPFSVLQVYVFPLLWWLTLCHSLCYRSTCFLYYDDLRYVILCVTGRLVSFIMMTCCMPFSVLQVDLFPLLWWLTLCHSLCYRSTCFLYYDDLLYAILCVTGLRVSFIMMTYSMPFSVLQVDLFPLLWCHSLCYRSTCFLFYDDLLYAILCVTGLLVSFIMMTCGMPFSVLHVYLFPLLWWLTVCHSLCYRSTCFLHVEWFFHNARYSNKVCDVNPTPLYAVSILFVHVLVCVYIMGVCIHVCMHACMYVCVYVSLADPGFH